MNLRLISTFVAVAVLGLAAITPVKAHGVSGAPGTDGTLAAGRHLAEELNLSGAQRTQIAAIIAQRRKDAAAVDRTVPADDPASGAARRVQIQAIREKSRAQIDAILTPEQREVADALRARAEAKWMNVRADLKEMAVRLRLSEEQLAALRPILRNQFQQLRDLRKSGLLRTERVAEFRRIRQATIGKVDAVLTPAQQQTMKEVRQEGRRKWMEGGRARRGDLP